MGGLDFELKSKDIAGRVGKLTINGMTITTPALMPVVNPQKEILPAKEIQKEFGSKIIMTNAYTLLKNEELKEKALKKGVHHILGVKDCLVATDSGSYQLMVYGAVETNNTEVLMFQEGIGSDIGSFLDVPTLPTTFKPRAEEQLKTTLERANEAKSASFVVNAGVQGGRFLDLRAKCAKALGRDFELIAVGGIVPFLESYRFRELVDVIASVKKNIPLNRPVHAFGLGHPMVFGLAVALGCDLFDSASYMLYAREGRYMTSYGTKRLDDLEYVSCTCPVCSKHGSSLRELSGDERVREVARHNLYACLSEIESIKQAVVEGRLWELVAVRCRSHPRLFAGFKALLKHGRWLSRLDPVTKKSAFFETGFESKYRSEAVNARDRIKRVSSDNLVKLPVFGLAPAEVLDVYPLGQTEFAGEDPRSRAPKIRDIAKLRALMEYQFGAGAGQLLSPDARIRRSRTTQRIRAVYDKRELIATVRAQDHFIIPKEALAEKLLRQFKPPKLRVRLKDEPDAVECVSEGKSVFAKFVDEVDPDLRAGDEVLVVDKNDKLIRTGSLVLAPKEIKDFTRGVAVRTR